MILNGAAERSAASGCATGQGCCYIKRLNPRTRSPDRLGEGRQCNGEAHADRPSTARMHGAFRARIRPEWSAEFPSGWPAARQETRRAATRHLHTDTPARNARTVPTAPEGAPVWDPTG